MGEKITLTTSDGHQLDAYRAEPSGAPKGGLVVVQEIFGVNSQIRSTVDHFAGLGYTTIAPALFDRVGKDIELGYNEDDFATGRETRGKITDEWITADVSAAVQEVASAGKVSVIGFCFGGYATYVAACTVDGVSAAMPFYGGGIAARSATCSPNARHSSISETRTQPSRWTICRRSRMRCKTARSMSTTTLATVLHATTGTHSMRGPLNGPSPAQSPGWTNTLPDQAAL